VVGGRGGCDEGHPSGGGTTREKTKWRFGWCAVNGGGLNGGAGGGVVGRRVA